LEQKIYRRNFVLHVINGALSGLGDALMDSRLIITAFLSQLTTSNVLIGLIAPLRDTGWFLPQLFITGLVERAPVKLDVYRATTVARAITWGLLLAAVFTSDALTDKRNTDAVEVGPNQLAAARVMQHMPARSLPLAEVQDRVRARLVEEQAAALARSEGQARVAALQAGGGGEPLPIVITASRTQAQGLPRPLLDAALRADANKLPLVTGVDLGTDGYVVMRVMQVLPREQPPGGEAPLREQYAQAWANAEVDAYLGALKRRYKASVTPAAESRSAAAATDR